MDVNFREVLARSEEDPELGGDVVDFLDETEDGVAAAGSFLFLFCDPSELVFDRIPESAVHCPCFWPGLLSSLVEVGEALRVPGLQIVSGTVLFVKGDEKSTSFAITS